MNTHTNTHLASVFITQQEILGADDRDIEIKSPACLKTAGAAPFVHGISSSFIPLSSQILPTGSAELVFYTIRSGIQRYVTFLQILYFDKFSSIKDFCLRIPRGSYFGLHI